MEEAATRLVSLAGREWARTTWEVGRACFSALRKSDADIKRNLAGMETDADVLAWTDWSGRNVLE